MNILYLITISFMLALVRSDVDCGENCVCSHSVMSCTGTLISTPPDNITEVRIADTDFEVMNTVFARDPVAWSRIIYLSLHSTSSEILPSGTFEGLDSLTFLKVYGEFLLFLQPGTFSGLDNLKTLDLSYNEFLDKDLIMIALGSRPVDLPYLDSLNISFCGRKHFYRIPTNRSFFYAIADSRHIRSLDISGVSFDEIYISDFYTICDNGLEQLYMRDSIISDLDFDYAPDKTCKYLQTLDLSGCMVVSGMHNYFQMIFDMHCNDFIFFTALKTLLLEKMSALDIKTRDYTHLNLSDCPFQFEHLSLSGNTFRLLNFSYTLHSVTIASLNFLDISNNGLEYVSPRTLTHSTGLTCLNFSNNHLYKMQRDYIDDFTKLLNAQTNLKEVDLSGNLLVDLPFTFFWNNTELIRIDLSNNELESISFNVSQMKHLEVLNVTNNKILILDAWTVGVLRSLQNVVVYISNNPLKCECDTLATDFFDWLVDSTQLQKQIMNNVHCINDNTQYRLYTSNAVRDLRHMCDDQRLKHILVIVIPVITSLIVAAIVVFVLLRRRRLNKIAFDKIISKIRRNELPYEFLTFLCFASDDNELVDTNVYQSMNTTFREIIGVDRDFVCKGDLCFRPGFHIMNETARCIEKCAVVVAAVSNTFCQRHWCEKEMMHGYNIGKPIVLILLEKIDKALMPPIVARSFNTFVHAALITDNNEVRLEPSWTNLCKSIIELAGKGKYPRERDVENDKNDIDEINLQNL